MATDYRKLPTDTSTNLSLRSLCDSVWKNVSLSHPDVSTKVRQSLAVKQFIGSLASSKLRRDLGLLSPRTLDEAYNAACRESDWRSACTFAHAEGKKSSPSMKKSIQLVCYKCRVAGHIARNCPKIGRASCRERV